MNYVFSMKYEKTAVEDAPKLMAYIVTEEVWGGAIFVNEMTYLRNISGPLLKAEFNRQFPDSSNYKLDRLML